MDFNIRVTVGPNPAAERQHGKIVEVETDTGDIREVLFHPEGDTTFNALVDGDTVAREIVDAFAVWYSASGYLWRVLDAEVVGQ